MPQSGGYFAAGTLVVWDVDVLREECVRIYSCRRSGKSYRLWSRRTGEAEPACQVGSWQLMRF